LAGHSQLKFPALALPDRSRYSHLNLLDAMAPEAPDERDLGDMVKDRWSGHHRR
jgi:hypothetical protein